MIDSFVLWTPLLLLPIVALLAFVGCNWFFGIHETEPYKPGPGPTGVIATGGNMEVIITWDPYPNATGFRVHRGDISGDYGISYDIQGPDATSYSDITNVVNGNTYFYVVTAFDLASGLESNTSAEVSAVPALGALTSFVIPPPTTVPPTIKLTNYFGMSIRVGASDVTVYKLGRFFVPGNSDMHAMKIVNDNGTDLTGDVAVDMTGPQTNGFCYGILSPPAKLFAGASYYIVSKEGATGDAFFDRTATVNTTAVAAVISSGKGPPYAKDSTPGHTYGPVNFLY